MKNQTLSNEEIQQADEGYTRLRADGEHNAVLELENTMDDLGYRWSSVSGGFIVDRWSQEG